ncbi:AraC family transcriptional regulator [Paenibacillus stellifer]|uniref:AraC family transcriptional regulator n=1 Tax=Paenibacillus stellifer TaxID=169760 RepID=A0A089LXJ0_9BACL|nr:AraC family transcriptional regulator [Paenibacillus stellifer]AIQ65642.1 AraC family transcriptional regulator [Paenibacillus stellifer]
MESKMIFGKSDETSLLPLYMTTAGYWEHQTETVRTSGFPDFQLHQVLNGQGRLIIGEKDLTVGPGDVFFLFPEIPHRYTPISDRWELAWVSFQGREARQLLAYAGLNESGAANLRRGSLLNELQQMLAMEEGEDEFEAECSKLLYQLLLDLKKLLPAPVNRDYGMERIRPVLRHIAENLERPLPLAELGDIAGVSPQYLCRLFQKTLKLRPLAYINQERINRSKKLMFSEAGRKIYEIAGLVGYENPSYFCAVFKRHTGMSPEDFKELHGLGR